MLTFFIVQPFILTIILASIFAIVLQPLYKKILETIPEQKSIASLTTVILTCVCLLIPFLFISTQIFKESVALYGTVTNGGNEKNLIISTIDGAGLVFENLLPGAGEYFAAFSNNLGEYTKQGLEWLIAHLGVVVSGFSLWLLDVFIFFIALYYLIRDGGGSLKVIAKLSPLDKEDMKIIFKRLELAVNSVIKGNLLIAFLQGTFLAIGFALFGVPNALLWGTVAVMTALIPGVGTGLVILPGIIYLFIVSNLFGAIGLIIWGALIVGLIDNLLRPKLVGDALSLHPLLILLSILGGLFLFGSIGLFLGPIVMSLLFAFIDTYVDSMKKIKVKE